MIIETIGYGESREILMDNGMHEWMKPSIIAKVEDKDDVLDCLNALRDKIALFFKETESEISSSSYFINNEEQVLIENTLPKKSEIKATSAFENMKNAIEGSSSLKVLETFKLIVKNKPELQDIYNNTHNKLSQWIDK